MIRWYDYIAAAFAADIILTGLIIGFFGPTLWHGFIGGAFAGITYRIWVDFYCVYRKNKEI